jgi:hypothetical protein
MFLNGLSPFYYLIGALIVVSPFRLSAGLFQARRSRPIGLRRAEPTSNCVQNPAFYRPISGVEASKANCITLGLWSGRWESNRTPVEFSMMSTSIENLQIALFSQYRSSSGR